MGLRLVFLSCLCGSEPDILEIGLGCEFLSCLCGSEQKSQPQRSSFSVSELPVRQ